jgi:hypothetical protein
MKLIYIDESGNTGTRSDDPAQPYHLLAALVIDDFNVRTIENDIRTLGLKHFGAASQNTDFEFHGYEIHKGKGRYFSGLKIEKRIEIMDDLLQIIKNHELQIIYIVINKALNQAKLHPHQLAFLLLVQRIEDYLISQNSLGLLVADENDDIEQRLIDDLERFKTVDTGFGYRSTKAEHIIDSVHFVKSNNNHLIQLADVVAYVLLRGKRVKEELLNKYNEQQPTINWNEWINENASPRQKTEARHFSTLEYRQMISEESAG